MQASVQLHERVMSLHQSKLNHGPTWLLASKTIRAPII